MKDSPKASEIALWMMLVLLASTGIAAAADGREFVGEVVGVAPDAKRVILQVPDTQSGEVTRMTVLVRKDTRLQGIQNVSELKEGAPIQVEVKKNWVTRQWVAERLIYAPARQRQGSSSVETAQLHDAEHQFAQGQMGDIEYETKRQVLEK